MVDAHNASRLRFDGVEIEADAVIGEGTPAARCSSEALDRRARGGRGAAARRWPTPCSSARCAYLKERRQFDRAIGEFQALQHRAAELYIDIELTRALVLGALQAVDADIRRRRRRSWHRRRRKPAPRPTARCAKACKCTAASA